MLSWHNYVYAFRFPDKEHHPQLSGQLNKLLQPPCKLCSSPHLWTTVPGHFCINDLLADEFDTVVMQIVDMFVTKEYTSRSYYLAR